jgi:predicted transcriptional regulator
MSPHVLEVSVNDTVRAAITTMMKHRINQIPIFQLNPRKYEGVITIDSIRRLFLSGRNVDEILSMKLGELREKSGKNAQGILENPTPFRPDDDLVHIWQYLEGHYYAVVQNEDGLVVGMITRRSCLEPFSKLLNEVY